MAYRSDEYHIREALELIVSWMETVNDGNLAEVTQNIRGHVNAIRVKNDPEEGGIGCHRRGIAS